MVGTAQDVTEQRQVDKLREDILSAVSHELPYASHLRARLRAHARAAQVGARPGDGRRDHLRHRPGRTQARAAPRRPPRHRAAASGAHGGPARARSTSATSCVGSWRTIRSTAVWSASPEGRWRRTSTVPKLERIVDNLVVNAAKHTPPEDPIEIRVETLGRDLLLVVEDEGPGIADEYKLEVFETFNRGPEHVVHDPGRRHRPRPRGALRRHPRRPDLGRGRARAAARRSTSSSPTASSTSPRNRSRARLPYDREALSAEERLRGLQLPVTIAGCTLVPGPEETFDIRSHGLLAGTHRTLFHPDGDTARIVSKAETGLLVAGQRSDTPIEPHVEVLRELGFAHMIVQSGQQYEIGQR